MGLIFDPAFQVTAYAAIQSQAWHQEVSLPSQSTKIAILNGPNLNLLGTREPDIYGTQTLQDIEDAAGEHAGKLGVEVDFRQTNHEGQMVDWIQEIRNNTAGLIINAGAYSHTSIAILDALSAYSAPIIEVHLSNIYRRESFRHHSYISKAAHGVICGLGAQGYLLAIDGLTNLIKNS